MKNDIQKLNIPAVKPAKLGRRNDDNITTMVRYKTKIEQIEQLDPQKRQQLKKVADEFDFRCNDYYLSLIDFDDPNDPIRRIIIPDMQELETWGKPDPSDEKAYTVMPGVEHKYNSTALLLVSNVCDGICRYCFRKRIFREPQSEYLRDVPAAMQYIKSQPQINNVLLTGGDPLVLSTSKLENIISQLRDIDHVQIIRIGTKIPAFNPYRIINDPALLKMVDKYSTDDKKIYFMTHFMHTKELTDVACKAVSMLQRAGAVLANQTPIISGITDDPAVLAELLAKLSFIGAAPYYIFQCRPAYGNKAYTVPIERAYEIVEQAKSQVSGLAKRVRFVMSHSSGKIEIVGKTEKFVYFKYHRAANDTDSGRFLVFKSNPQAYWFDDYDELVQACPIDLPHHSHCLD
jgi:KamA family protein